MKYILFTLLLLTQSLSAALFDNLTHYWPLESNGNRTDSIGGTTLQESGGTVPAVTGKHGNAASFVDTGASLLSSNFSLPLPCTLAVWFRQSRVGDYVDILVYNQANYDIELVNDSYFTYDMVSDGGMQILLFGALDTWHLLTLTIGTNSFTAAVDNVAYPYAGYQDDWHGFGPLRLGGNSAQVVLDELMIWNVELTTSQLTDLWNNGNGRFP